MECQADNNFVTIKSRNTGLMKQMYSKIDSEDGDINRRRAGAVIVDFEESQHNIWYAHLLHLFITNVFL